MRDAVTPALPVSDRDLERVLCGDAPPALVARVEALAKTDARLAAHLAARRAEQAAFDVRHPRLPAAIAAAERAPWGFASWLRLPVFSGALALASVLTFLVVRAPEDAVRTKGDGADAPVTLVAKRGARVFAVGPGALLKPGDALRVEVACGQEAVVVVGIHEPDTKRASVLEPGARVPAARTTLAGSFVLDAHLGDEELWVVCARDAASAAQVTRVIESGARPAGAHVLPIRKRP